MATFNRPRNSQFCRGYKESLEDMAKTFKDIHSYDAVLRTTRHRIIWYDDESKKEAFLGISHKELFIEIFFLQGKAQAWADLHDFCIEAQIGWNVDLFSSWLTLHQKLVEAHTATT